MTSQALKFYVITYTPYEGLNKLHYFKLLSKWELSIGLNFKSNILYLSIASKNIQSDMNYVSKNT